METLTQEQDKLALMGTIKPSKDQSFVVGDSNMNSKYNKKDTKPLYQNGDKSKSQEDSSNSKKKKGKGEGSKCEYCGKEFHHEIPCMKKWIDMLTQLM